MGIRRTEPAVYDLKYHLLWIPKYRRNVFTKVASDYAKNVFNEIAGQYEYRIDTMEVMGDHVHVFIEAPPGYSPAKIVQIMNSISAREIFRRFPELRKRLWAGELWKEGHVVLSV